MARTPTKFEQPIIDVAPTTDEEHGMAVALRNAQQDAQLVQLQNANACAMATQLGYEGKLNVETLEDEIRFFQRRTVEACLELGKRLLLLREITPRGNSQIGKDDFESRMESLGLPKSSAYRFMQAAAKTAKSANLSHLSTQVKSMSVFFELIMQDDDVLDDLKTIDNIDTLSASQLRAKVREMAAEKQATDKLVETKNKQIDDLQLVRVLPEDDLLIEIRKVAVKKTMEATTFVRGDLRQALIAVRDAVAPNWGSKDLYMADMVGQLQAELNALRSEFNLPDVSRAADLELAAEVAQYA